MPTPSSLTNSKALMAGNKTSAYARAGVNIDAMMDALQRIGKKVKQTATPGVVSEPAAFGGLFKAPGKDHLLVGSMDGVGTKLKVAHMIGCHHTIGQDLVNHCVNDILVHGARPLFFLDYLGTSALDPKVFEEVISGFCTACKENGAALLGGETAEMPDLYPVGEYDLVGAVIGAVERKQLVTGKNIRKGDVLIGLPSTGLHTNGYALARKVIFEIAGKKPGDLVPGTKATFEQVLLAIHRSYLHPVSSVMKKIDVHGMAHITGGGLCDNVPRVLPTHLDARFECSAWKPPPIFTFIKKAGGVDREEMYRVFNMGIGFVLIVAARDAGRTLKRLKSANQQAKVIGHVVSGSGKTILA